MLRFRGRALAPGARFPMSQSFPPRKEIVMEALAVRETPEMPGNVEITDITAEARGNAAFDGHERIVRAVDADAGLHAIIAIHDRTLGPAIGGCRMWSYESEDAALTDALRLSRGMTYKSAMAGVPFSGGKAVILGDPRIGKSGALFRAFGRAVETLAGTYISGEDVGVTVDDMNRAAEETSHILGTGERGGDPSPWTAYGVSVGIEAAVRHRLGRDSLAGATVAVQGAGSVGYKLCDRLAFRGAKLIVADISPEAAMRAGAAFDADVVAPEEIYGVQADVFAPCALGAAIDDDTLGRLRCAVVAGSANNQLREARHGEALRARNVLYAPDYVINAGGMIALTLQLHPDGFSPERAGERTAAIGWTLAEIFERADREGSSPATVADRIAAERIANPAGRSW